MSIKATPPYKEQEKEERYRFKSENHFIVSTGVGVEEQ